MSIYNLVIYFERKVNSKQEYIKYRDRIYILESRIFIYYNEFYINII